MLMCFHVSIYLLSYIYALIMVMIKLGSQMGSRVYGREPAILAFTTALSPNYDTGTRWEDSVPDFLTYFNMWLLLDWLW